MNALADFLGSIATPNTAGTDLTVDRDELAERAHPVAALLRPIIGSGVERARVSLPLPEGLPFDVWATIGEGLCRVERSIQWLIGDWWVYGERRYGKRKALVERL